MLPTTNNSSQRLRHGLGAAYIFALQQQRVPTLTTTLQNPQLLHLLLTCTVHTAEPRPQLMFPLVSHFLPTVSQHRGPSHISKTFCSLSSHHKHVATVLFCEESICSRMTNLLLTLLQHSFHYWQLFFFNFFFSRACSCLCLLTTSLPHFLYLHLPLNNFPITKQSIFHYSWGTTMKLLLKLNISIFSMAFLYPIAGKIHPF